MLKQRIICLKKIKNTGINLTEEKDVKKAYELILNKYFNK